MTISAYLSGPQEVTVNLDYPVIFTGTLSAFAITGANILSFGAQTVNDHIILNIDVAPDNYDDFFLAYTRPTLGPALTYLAGPIPDRVIPSFETLIIVTSTPTPLQYDVATTSDVPTVGDFIDMWGLTEATVLTNPENSFATMPNEEKILRALEDANALWSSYVIGAAAANYALINANKRRTILVFARYFVDTRSTRPHVLKAFELAEKELKITTATATGGTGIVDDEYTSTSDLIFGSAGNCFAPSGCGCGPSFGYRTTPYF